MIFRSGSAMNPMYDTPLSGIFNQETLRTKMACWVEE
jgi:hypothetical protein